MLAYGLPGGVNAPVLSAGGPQIDVWHSTASITEGTCGAVRWRSDGRWLFGVLDVAEAADAATADATLALQHTARRAYADGCATLRQAGGLHLHRVWNYLPSINAQAGALERYRQFNIGRQQAFLDAGEDAFEGSPAACAIGLDDGPLALRFLAGRGSPLPLDNPRQVPAWRYPTAYGPRCPTFSRAALRVEIEGHMLAAGVLQ